MKMAIVFAFVVGLFGCSAFSRPDSLDALVFGAVNKEYCGQICGAQKVVDKADCETFCNDAAELGANVAKNKVEEFYADTESSTVVALSCGFLCGAQSYMPKDGCNEVCKMLAGLGDDLAE